MAFRAGNGIKGKISREVCSAGRHTWSSNKLEKEARRTRDLQSNVMSASNAFQRRGRPETRSATALAEPIGVVVVLYAYMPERVACGSDSRFDDNCGT